MSAVIEFATMLSATIELAAIERAFSVATLPLYGRIEGEAPLLLSLLGADAWVITEAIKILSSSNGTL